MEEGYVKCGSLNSSLEWDSVEEFAAHHVWMRFKNKFQYLFLDNEFCHVKLLCFRNFQRRGKISIFLFSTTTYDILCLLKSSSLFLWRSEYYFWNGEKFNKLEMEKASSLIRGVFSNTRICGNFWKILFMRQFDQQNS